MPAGVSPADVIAFWREAGPDKWYAKDAAFDTEIAARFGEAYHQAARGELDDWITTPEGTLALILLLDQFPRNMFRGTARAFATDPIARDVADFAYTAQFDGAEWGDLGVFFYLPFEHSESLADQDRGVALCEALDAASGSDWARWARMHRDIIRRFGRFPHRNTALGRETTDEEQEFLDKGGFSG